MTNVRHQEPSLSDPADTAADERAARLAAVELARTQFKRGDYVPGDAVFAWLESWGTPAELPPPEPAPKS